MCFGETSLAWLTKALACGVAGYPLDGRLGNHEKGGGAVQLQLAFPVQLGFLEVVNGDGNTVITAQEQQPEGLMGNVVFYWGRLCVRRGAGRVPTGLSAVAFSRRQRAVTRALLPAGAGSARSVTGSPPTPIFRILAEFRCFSSGLGEKPQLWAKRL